MTEVRFELKQSAAKDSVQSPDFAELLMGIHTSLHGSSDSAGHNSDCLIAVSSKARSNSWCKLNTSWSTIALEHH